MLQVSDGILTGATGVDVDGVAYDVQFIDGSCIGVFDGCLPSSFAFSTLASASIASQALLDQVFIDDIWEFDAIPSATSGCSAENQECIAVTPYAVARSEVDGELYFAGSGAFNSPGGLPDFTLGDISERVDFDYATVTTSVFAVWALSAPVGIPEPGSLALISVGLFGLVARKRRQRRAV